MVLKPRINVPFFTVMKIKMCVQLTVYSKLYKFCGGKLTITLIFKGQLLQKAVVVRPPDASGV